MDAALTKPRRHSSTSEQHGRGGVAAVGRGTGPGLGEPWVLFSLRIDHPWRTRFVLLVVVILSLTSCPVWPYPQYTMVRLSRNGSLWAVEWQTWGEPQHILSYSYGSACLIEAMLWQKGRTP